MSKQSNVIVVSVNGLTLNFASDRLRRNVNFCIECAKIDKNSSKYFMGEAKDLFEKYHNNIVAVEVKQQQNKVNEALLAKLSTKKVVNTTKIFKRILYV
jgi:hypothetical protein